MVGGLGLLATLIGLYQFFWPIVSPPKPKAMTGDLNVAVAGFDGAQEATRDVARALSDSIYRALRRELGSLPLDIQVRGPDAVGGVSGETAAERLGRARQIAADNRADIVLYGVLANRAGGSEFEPEFYLDGRKLRHPEDRRPVIATVDPPAPAGRHPLGTIEVAGAVDQIIPARARLRARVAGRARAFALFVIGLAYYTDALTLDVRGVPESRRFAAAARYFSAAQRTGDWDPRAGEILYLFLGNSALKRGQLAAAERYYGRALRIRPGYLRAAVGAAEVRFHRSRDDCEPGRASVRGLSAAAEGYRAVLRAVPWPSVLAAKAEFGLGRAELCVGIAVGGRGWHSPRARFRRIVDAFRGGFTPVRRQAAEAYAGIGLSHLLAGLESRSEVELRRAARAYRSAVGLSESDERKGIFHAVLGFIHAELDEPRRARAQYARAITLDPQGSRQYRAEAHRLLGGG